MNFSLARRGAMLALALGAAACTTPSDVLTGPTVTTFAPILNPTPQVGGLFAGTMTLTSVSGGTGALRSAGGNECVAVAFETARLNGNSSNDASLTITQDKTDPTLVTARLASEETGLACSYKGNIGSSNGLILDAPAADCSGTSLVIRCLPDPVTGVILIREMRLVSSSLTATFDGWPTSVTAVHGRTAETYNVYDIDGKAVAGFVANHDLFVTRR